MQTIPCWPLDREVDLNHELKETFDLNAPATDLLNEIFGPNYWMQVGDQGDDYDTSFNTMRFNTVDSIIVDMAVTLHGRGSLRANANMEMFAKAHLSGRGSLLARISREIPMKANLSGTGSLVAIMTRERYVKAHLSGRGTLRARANRYRVNYLTFTGEFKPGEKITIIMEKFKVIRNEDENILKHMGGDFFNLGPGNNELEYTDSVTSRKLKIKITHGDRYL